jgi:hypothetical protein
MNINFAQYLIGIGLPAETLYLLLVLPFVALLVSFFIQVIGVKSYGLYEPIVVSYSLYSISPDFTKGLLFGLPVIALSWLVSEVTRRLLKKSRIHYASKVSIKISIASIVLIAFLAVATYFGQNGYLTVNILPIVIIISLIEAISLFQLKTDNIRSNLVSLQTIILIIISYFIISNKLIKELLLNNSYLVIVPFFLNIYIGNYRGLRLAEHLRFKDILKND